MSTAGVTVAGVTVADVTITDIAVAGVTVAAMWLGTKTQINAWGEESSQALLPILHNQT